MAVNGKTILGNPHASNKFITRTDKDLALTYYVVSNRSVKKAIVHIIAGNGNTNMVIPQIELLRLFRYRLKNHIIA